LRSTILPRLTSCQTTLWRMLIKISLLFNWVNCNNNMPGFILIFLSKINRNML
jgi:hypothetical protein